jgi:hypothetical protein
MRLQGNVGEKDREGRISFVAVCQCIDSPNKETETPKLFILSDTEIELDGAKYQKCEPIR